MANVELGNEELVPRIEKAISVLTKMSDDQTNPKEKVRLTNKIDGAVAVLNAHRERFQHMRTSQDVVTLAAMIGANYNPRHQEGVKLVQGYLMDYYVA